MSRPLLVVDGDSFAHRAYHALPKSIRRADGRPGNALVGFTNMLLRFWEWERPRTVLVAWDRLDVPTYRHTAFPAYQSGRVFDDELLEQLAVEHPRPAQIVELRVFGGLLVEEVAEVLGLGTTTVKADWRFARAWLQQKQGLPGT